MDKKEKAPQKEPKLVFKYVGPAYVKGMQVHRGPVIQPLRMSEQEINEIIKSYPACEKLWRKVRK